MPIQNLGQTGIPLVFFHFPFEPPGQFRYRPIIHFQQFPNFLQPQICIAPQSIRQKLAVDIPSFAALQFILRDPHIRKQYLIYVIRFDLLRLAYPYLFPTIKLLAAFPGLGKRPP